MARPRDEAKRTELLKRAIEVIRQRGASRVTMTELADSLGMKRSTLYWYFKDLGEVFDAALREVIGRQEVYVRERVMGCSHPIDRLIAFTEAVHAFFDEDPDEIVVLLQLWAVGEKGEPTRAIQTLNQGYALWRAMTIAELRAGIRVGLIAPTVEPETLLDLVTAAIDGALIHRISRGATPYPTLRLLCDMVLRPLRLGAAPQADFPAAAS